jgi:hypothetical protein
MPDRPAPAVVIRSASDVARLINSGTARGANAGMITFIALGGIFIDAYDLRGQGGRLTLWQVIWYAATTCSFLVPLVNAEAAPPGPAGSAPGRALRG